VYQEAKLLFAKIMMNNATKPAIARSFRVHEEHILDRIPVFLWQSLHSPLSIFSSQKPDGLAHHPPSQFINTQ
jgi:hypothetical protein